MKRSKAYRQADELIQTRLYSPAEAVGLARKTSHTKFDPALEVAQPLGADPRQADPMVRGPGNMPPGTGKTARRMVFAAREPAEEARARRDGARGVGSGAGTPRRWGRRRRGGGARTAPPRPGPPGGHPPPPRSAPGRGWAAGVRACGLAAGGVAT